MGHVVVFCSEFRPAFCTWPAKKIKKMRYLFQLLDQQTTTTELPQWALRTHRNAPCLHLDGRVADLDTLITFEFPQYSKPLSLSPTRAHMGLLNKKVDGIFSSITFEVDCCVYDFLCLFRF